MGGHGLKDKWNEEPDGLGYSGHSMKYRISVLFLIGIHVVVFAKDLSSINQDVSVPLDKDEKQATQLHFVPESLREDLFKALYYPDRMGYPLDDCLSATWLLKEAISIEGKKLNLLKNDLSVIKGDHDEEFGCIVKLGSYTIKTLKGYIRDGEEVSYQSRGSVSLLTEEGRVSFKLYPDEPARVAVPDDPKLPTYIYHHGLYTTDRLESEFIPQDYQKKWTRVSWKRPTEKLPVVFVSYLKKKPAESLSTKFTPPPFKAIPKKEATQLIENSFTMNQPRYRTSYFQALFSMPRSPATYLAQKIEIDIQSMKSQDNIELLRRPYKLSGKGSSSMSLSFSLSETVSPQRLKEYRCAFKVSFPIEATDRTYQLETIEKEIPGLHVVYQDSDSIEIVHPFSEMPMVIGYEASGNQLFFLSDSHRTNHFSIQFSGKPEKVRMIVPSAWEDFSGQVSLPVYDSRRTFVSNTARHQYRQHLKLEREVNEDEVKSEEVRWVKTGSSSRGYLFFPYSGTVHPHYTWSVTTVYDTGASRDRTYSSHSYNGRGVYFYPRSRRDGAPVYLEGELQFGTSTNISLSRFSPSSQTQILDMGLETPLVFEREEDKLILKMPVDSHVCSFTYVDRQGFIMVDPAKKTESNKGEDPSKPYGYMMTISPPEMPGEVILQLSRLPVKKPIPFVVNIGKLTDQEMQDLKQKTEISRNMSPVLKQIMRAYAPFHPYHKVGIAERYFSFNNDKKASALIPLEVAHSDPLGAAVFGYQVKPYLGYTFTLAKGWSKRGMPQSYKTTKEGSATISWKGGKVSTSRYMVDPVVVAIPSDKKMPVFYLEKGKTYQCVGGPTDFIPVKEERKGWSSL